MVVDSLVVKVGVDVDIAVCEMYDVAQELETMLDLVPDWQKHEAKKIKTRIINRMVSWLENEEKPQD